jgi:lipopolysaccharide export system protein LptA
MSARQKGLFIAVAFALIAAGVTLFLLFRGGGARGAGGLSATKPDIGKPPPPPAMERAAGSGRARVEFADKRDPTRKAGEMEWASLEPLPERGWSLLTEPRAWWFGRDGRTIHIQAATGRIYRSEQGNEPESGRFEGGVLVRIYEPAPNGQPRTIDLEADRPSVLVFTPGALSFDLPKAEVSTRDRVEVSTADVEFAATGMLANLNQVEGRLESAEFDRGGEIRMVTDRSGPRAATSAVEPMADAAPAEPGAGTGAEDAASGAEPGAGVAGPPVAATDAGPAEPADRRAGRETLYRAVFTGQVRLKQDQRALAADALEIWARTVDNRLPAGAIAPVRLRSGEERSEAAGGGAAAAPAPPADESPALPSPVPSRDEDGVERATAAASIAASGGGVPSSLAPDRRETDLVLTWTGPLAIRPLAAAPAELSDGNDVALRFTADRAGAVTFSDEGAGVSGRCAWIGYGATTRDLVLSSPGPTALSLTTRDGKRAVAGRFQTNLGTGVSHIPGGGVFEDGERRITWSDQADLLFAAGDAGASRAAAGTLLEASFTGTVVARDRQSSISGDFLRAVLTPTTPKASVLTRLIVDGNAVAAGGEDERRGGRTGRIAADRLDLGLRPSPDGRESVPSVLSAEGSVAVRSGAMSFTARSLQAGLDRDANDPRKVVVTDLSAEGPVAFMDGERGVSAGADALRADAQRQTATLTGTAAFVQAGLGRISGPRIDLDGVRRTVDVPAAGTFHRAADPKARRTDRGRAFAGEVKATWTGSMHADDAAGTIECRGEVSAISGEGTATVDVLHGERLRIALTPGSADRQPSDPEAAGRQEPERRLLRAEVYGASEALPATGGGAAMAERRRYVTGPGEGERRLEQFLRVSGGQIIYDAETQRVTVPGRGEAAVYAGERTGEPRRGGATPDVRGASLFTWLGDMGMDLSSGVLTMRRSVTLYHRPLNDDPATRIECEWLEATLRGTGVDTAVAAAGAEAGAATTAEGLASARGAQLVKAMARGAVYVESGPRKLIADLLSYDAVEGTSEASAAANNRISIFDDTRGTSVTARRMFWDMVRDRIEVKEPSPIAVPR